MKDRKQIEKTFIVLYEGIASRIKFEDVLRKQFEDIEIANSFTGYSSSVEFKQLQAMIEAHILRERTILKELLISLKLSGFFD